MNRQLVINRFRSVKQLEESTEFFDDYSPRTRILLQDCNEVDRLHDEPETVSSVICAGLLPQYQSVVDSALEVEFTVLLDWLRSYDFRTRLSSQQKNQRYGSVPNTDSGTHDLCT